MKTTAPFLNRWLSPPPLAAPDTATTVCLLPCTKLTKSAHIPAAPTTKEPDALRVDWRQILLLVLIGKSCRQKFLCPAAALK